MATKGYLATSFLIERNSSSTLCAQTSLIVYDGIGSSGMLAIVLRTREKASVGSGSPRIALLES